MARIGSLQVPDTWTYALVGAVVVGSAFAGYLIKRRDGNSTGTGFRAGLIGGLPTLWALSELLQGIANIPNPPWFQAVSTVVALAVGGLIILIVAGLGALAGRFGGWVAERRGHDGVAAERSHT